MSMVLRTIYDDLIDNLVCDFSDYYCDDIFDDYCDICEPEDYTIIPVATVQLPVLGVKEMEKEYTVDLELPGYAKEEINVEMDGNVIMVSSDLKDKEFCRSIEVSEDVNPEEINATIDKGILTLRIPKKEVPPARKIEIKVPEEPKKLEVKEITPEVKEEKKE